MKTYSSHLFTTQKRAGGSWKWGLIGILTGFAGGFVVATMLAAHKPVDLVIATSSLDHSQEVAVVQQIPELWSESGNISVRVPQAHALVASPLVVSGQERIFEQHVVLRLKDSKGIELAKISVTGEAPDAGIHGPYHGELTFEKPKTKSGTLEVFDTSAKDGSEIDKVTVPVRFE